MSLVILHFGLATVDADRDKTHAVSSPSGWMLTGWCRIGQWYRQYSRWPTICTGSAGFPQTEQLAATYSVTRQIIPATTSRIVSGPGLETPGRPFGCGQALRDLAGRFRSRLRLAIA